MKWQLLPSRNTSCLFCCVYCSRTNFQWITFSLIRRYKRTAVVWHKFTFTQSILVILQRLRAVIERSKPFAVACLQQDPRSTMKGVQQGKENCIFALLPELIRTLRTLQHWELYLHVKCVAGIPKWEQHAKAIPSRSCYIRETATKHKDALNTSKGEFKRYSLLLHYPYVTGVWWTELCRILSDFLSRHATVGGCTCKLCSITFETTYQTNVAN